jgi:hypothetical protein
MNPERCNVRIEMANERYPSLKNKFEEMTSNPER